MTKDNKCKSWEYEMYKRIHQLRMNIMVLENLYIVGRKQNGVMMI